MPIARWGRNWVNNPDANLIRAGAKCLSNGLAFALRLGFSGGPVTGKKKATRKRPKSREETPKEGIR